MISCIRALLRVLLTAWSCAKLVTATAFSQDGLRSAGSELRTETDLDSLLRGSFYGVTYDSDHTTNVRLRNSHT
jgi:hypothetical protein